MKGAKNNKQAKNAIKRQPQQTAAQVNSLAGRVDRLLKQIPKGTFAATGAAAGAHFGGPPGRIAGGTLGRALSQITGYGDYTVNSNSMTGQQMLAGDPPIFKNNSLSTVIKHREYIADIVSTGTTFANTAYDVNPGNRALFPWLANVATSYQQYKVRGMVFEFKSTSSEYATGSGLGKVILASNYNVNEPTFDNVQEMENSEYAVANKPSVSFYHPVECARGARRDDPFYVKDPNKTDVGESDNRWYDMLKFQVATSGLSAPVDTTIGEIWVSYEIELLKPVVPRLLTPGPTPGPGTLEYSVFRKNGSDVSGIGQFGTFGLFAGNAGTSPNLQVTTFGVTQAQLKLSALPVGPFTFTMSRYNPGSAVCDITSATFITGGDAGMVFTDIADKPNYHSLVLFGVANNTTNELNIVLTAGSGQTITTTGYDMSITTASS